MTRLSKLTAGLMGASALVAFSGPAHAAGTAAGEVVENTFVLSYSTGTNTVQITNDGGAGNDDPTTFTVDRVVDLTVTGSATTTTPGEEDVAVLFTVVNEGNDTQDYTFTTSDGDQDFTLTDAAPLIQFYVSANATCAATPTAATSAPVNATLTTYDASTARPTVDADETLCVYVNQDIDPNAMNGESSEIDLLVTTVETDGTAIDYANAPGSTVTNDINAVESIANEGTASAVTGDADDDGQNGATSTYNVEAAAVTATKDVVLVSQDGSNCGNFTNAPTTDNSELMIPGACVEYTITTTNTGSAPATSINITDALPGEVTFSVAEVDTSDWGTEPTDTTASSGNCNTPATSCTVSFENGVLPAPTAPATSSEGIVRIRALIK